MEAISFTLSSRFGFFHWGNTRGDRRITNIFISKTEILGILGCVIGLDGYAQIHWKTEHGIKEIEPFFDILNGLNVSIIPLQRPAFFDDQLIHRNMHHINNRGSLMVQMTGLVEPGYKVVIEQGNVVCEVYEKLKTFLLNGWSEYIPYFGKNQFPVEIKDVEEIHLKELQISEDVVIRSIFKNSYLVEEQYVNVMDLKEDGYHYTDMLKNFDKEKAPLIVQEPSVWSSFETNIDVPIYQVNEQDNIVFL